MTIYSNNIGITSKDVKNYIVSEYHVIHTFYWTLPNRAFQVNLQVMKCVENIPGENRLKVTQERT